MVDIAQYADGRVTLSYRGRALKHKRYACQDQAGRSKSQDSKTVNTRVDQVRQKERRRIAELAAAMAHQDSQRRNWATSVRYITSVNLARSRHAASRVKYSNWTRVRHMRPRPARWSTSPSTPTGE